ncbi:hypothetical protein L7F22_012139 [Adiantum nelumboides]|nr:hypothetical protein [Adiantum nelumboides]
MLAQVMVLSNKQLKRRLRAQPAREQGTLLLNADQLKSINKREKKRQRRQQQLENPPAQQSGSPQTSPIDQAELDNYHRCIRSLLHEGDLSPSLGQEQDAKNVPVAAPRLPVKESQNAEASLPTLVNSEQNSLNVDFPSLPESTSKSRKRQRASKTNARMEEPDKVDNDSAGDQDLSESWTVYVGGIPYYSSEDDIKAFFGDCGTISEVNLKTFSDSGKFRGIALLTFKGIIDQTQGIAVMADRPDDVIEEVSSSQGQQTHEVGNAESKVYGSSATSSSVTAHWDLEAEVRVCQGSSTVFQAVPVQPATFQQPIAGSNGQGSNLQAMQQVFPPPSVHPGYFGGGSVFHSMAGHAPGNQFYTPGTVFGGAQTMMPNPMYGGTGMQPGFQSTQGQFGMTGKFMAVITNQQPNMASPGQINSGQGTQMNPNSVPMFQSLPYDNLTPLEKPTPYKGGKGVTPLQGLMIGRRLSHSSSSLTRPMQEETLQRLQRSAWQPPT